MFSKSPKFFKSVPKGRNFAQSGHTGRERCLMALIKDVLGGSPGLMVMGETHIERLWDQIPALYTRWT